MNRRGFLKGLIGGIATVALPASITKAVAKPVDQKEIDKDILKQIHAEAKKIDALPKKPDHILINDAFKEVLYTGDGKTSAFIETGFKPDVVIIKNKPSGKWYYEVDYNV